MCESLSPQYPRSEGYLAETKKKVPDRLSLRYILTGAYPLIFCIAPSSKLNAGSKHLLDVFCIKCLTFENISVKTSSTQKEIDVYRWTPSNSAAKKPDAHVRRVALICELLGRAGGLRKSLTIKHAALCMI